MTFSLLIAVTVVLFLFITGVSFLLFGREWIRARREEKFARALEVHSGLVSRGTESYTTETVDQIGNISSDTIVLGGRTFPFPRWEVERRVAWQDRVDGNDYFSVTAQVTCRF